jgi:hypothetical protein
MVQADRYPWACRYFNQIADKFDIWSLTEGTDVAGNNMNADMTQLLKVLALACAASCISACTIDLSDDKPAVTVAKEPAVPVYVSNLRVTTNCGVQDFPLPPAGFAETVGTPQRDMMPPVAKNMAIGADRPLAATDVERVSPGYVVIDPGGVRESFIINNDKEVVATFSGDYPIPMSQILRNGNRVINSNTYSDAFADGGGYRGCIEEYAPDGSLVWRLSLNTDDYIQHHDAIKIPNGNILAVVWEKVSATEAISQGLNPDNTAENGDFWYDGIVEINPMTTEIVWEWSIRHHVVQDFDPGQVNYGVVADHPERMNINSFKPNRQGAPRDDWTHVNAIDYNPELDQIAISSNHLSEIWIIDHSTTPQESAGHTGGRQGKGGDFLYRWGNPARYDRGGVDERTLFNQHDVQWIKPGLSGAGNLLIFNNGDGQQRPYTTATEITPPINTDGSYRLDASKPYGPETLTWEYNPDPPERFFSFFISGVQRLPNGNTLVNQGAGGKVREVTPDGDIVWEYHYENESPGPHMLFRANRYPADHPGIQEILRHSN